MVPNIEVRYGKSLVLAERLSWCLTFLLERASSLQLATSIQVGAICSAVFSGATGVELSLHLPDRWSGDSRPKPNFTLHCLYSWRVCIGPGVEHSVAILADRDTNWCIFDSWDSGWLFNPLLLFSVPPHPYERFCYIAQLHATVCTLSAILSETNAKHMLSLHSSNIFCLSLLGLTLNSKDSFTHARWLIMVTNNTTWTFGRPCRTIFLPVLMLFATVITTSSIALKFAIIVRRS